MGGVNVRRSSIMEPRANSHRALSPRSLEIRQRSCAARLIWARGLDAPLCFPKLRSALASFKDCVSAYQRVIQG